MITYNFDETNYSLIHLDSIELNNKDNYLSIDIGIDFKSFNK